MSAPAALARTLDPSALAAVLGIAALATRRPGLMAPVVALAVGVAALLAPVGRTRRPRAATWALVTAAGSAAFVAASMAGPALVLSRGALTVPAALVVAVAEEAFFRRFLYGWLERHGVAVAVVGTAVAFALIHAPLYGLWVVPLDLSAGLVLGWQRWAAGHWSAPAATHALANLLAYL